MIIRWHCHSNSSLRQCTSIVAELARTQIEQTSRNKRLPKRGFEFSSSLPITQSLPQARLSIAPLVFHSTTEVSPFEEIIPDSSEPPPSNASHLSDARLLGNDTASLLGLSTELKPPFNYALDNLSDSMHRSSLSWCPPRCFQVVL